MKITKSKLMEIIKEELAVVLESSMYGPTRLPNPDDEKERLPKRYNYEEEPTFDSPEVSSIGVTSDPGENPRSNRVRMARQRAEDEALGINRSYLRPEEARAHEILKRAGFRSRRRGDRRVNLAMTQGKGWKLSEDGARSILDDAVEAGEISHDTAYEVMIKLETELYRA